MMKYFVRQINRPFYKYDHVCVCLRLNKYVLLILSSEYVCVISYSFHVFHASCVCTSYLKYIEILYVIYMSQT